MSKSFCTRIDSPLFNQIRQRVGDYNTAVKMYTIIQTPTFRQTFGNSLTYNANNEPTIESLESVLDFTKNSTLEVQMQQYEQELNENMPSDNISVVAQAVSFNKQHDDVFVRIDTLNNNQSHYKVLPRMTKNQIEIDQLEKSLRTYQQIDNFLSQMGVDIRILDPQYFEKEDALIIPQNFNNIVDGVFGVVNIANNMKGFQALPEEFGHFIIECVKTNPIIQRLENLLNAQPEFIQQILKEEYQQVVNYYQQQNKPELISREALGRLLSQSINSNQLILEDVPLWKRSKSLITNFINTKFAFKNTYQSVTLDSIRHALENVAQSFVTNTKEHQQILQDFKVYGDRLAHTSDDIMTKLVPKCEQMLGKVAKFISIYKTEGNDLETIQELETILNNALHNTSLGENYNEVRQKGIAALFNQDDENEQENTPTVTEIRKELNNTAFLQYCTNLLRNSVPVIQKCLAQTQQLKHQLVDPSYDDVIRYSHDIRRNRDMMLAYQTSLQDITSLLIGVEYDHSVNEAEKQIFTDLTFLSRNIIDLIHTQIGELEGLAKNLLLHYYKFFFSEDGSTEIKYNGKGLERDTVVSLQYCLDYTKGDVSLISRLVDTSYNSRDALNGLVNQALKTQLEIVRTRAQEDLLLLDSMYEQFKGRDDMLFEKDENGNATGYYINKYGINFAKYKQIAAAEYSKIDNDTSLTAEQKRVAKQQWRRQHTRPIEQTMYTKNGETGEYEQNGTVEIYIPINDERWNSNAYANLNRDDQVLIDRLLELKHKMDIMNGLTGSFRQWQCIQKMVGSTLEAISSNNPNKFKNIFKHFKNLFTITSDDVTDIGDISIDETTEEQQALNGQPNGYFKRLYQRYQKRQALRINDQTDQTVNVLTNFEDNIYKRVPRAYVESLKDITQLSLSIGDTFSNYIAAAHQYEAMHEIVDLMELTTVVAKKRKQETYRKGKKMRRGTKTTDGQWLSEDLTIVNPYSHENQLLQHQIDTLMYGEYKHKDAQLGKASTAKFVDRVINLTTISMLGYNPFTAINNVNAGKLQMFIESMHGKYFTMKDWLWADKEYVKLIPDYFAELGSPIKNSKIALLMRTFNAEADWLDDMTKKDYFAPKTVNFARKMLSPSAAMNAGEMMMKWSTLGAMLHHYEMLDSTGNKTNLYEALDVVDKLDTDGKIIGKQLVIKKGYTKLDGTQFSLRTFKGDKRSDLQKMILTMNVINHRMHGVFNREDLVEIKKHAWGRLLMMYRNFMWPFLTKRWKGIAHFWKDPQHGLAYNFQTREFERGFYLTTALFFMNMIMPQNQDIAKHDFWFDGRAAYIFELMGPEQKQDVIRCLTEVVSTLILTALVIGIHGDWDDEDGQWVMRANNYFTRRLLQESTFAINPQSMLDILQSPTPVMGPLQDLKRIWEACYDNHILQSGPYKGQTKVKAAIKRATPIIPNITEFIHLDEADRTNGRFTIYHKYNFGSKIESDEMTEYQKYMKQLTKEEQQRNAEMEQEIANTIE